MKSSYDIAKDIGVEDIISQLHSANLREVGVYSHSIADTLEKILSQKDMKHADLKVVGALDNSDMEGAYLEILQTDARKVFEGLKIIGFVMDTSELFLHIPSYAAEIVKQMEPLSHEYGVKINIGMMDVQTKNETVMYHIITLKNICEVIDGTYAEGNYIAVNGEALKKIPNGIMLGDIVVQKNIKAVEVGYKLFTPEILETLVADLVVENGVIRGLQNNECIVQLTTDRLEAYEKASCGKCVFCREGLIQLKGMTKNLTLGRGKNENLSVVKEIAEAMGYSNLCTIGIKSADILLSSISGFRSEFEEHTKHKCTSGACSAFTSIYIDPKTCTGCEACLDVCPIDCIEGKKGFIHMIDELDCIKCGKCIAVCDDEAIVMSTARIPKLPSRLTKVGRFTR